MENRRILVKYYKRLENVEKILRNCRKCRKRYENLGKCLIMYKKCMKVQENV